MADDPSSVQGLLNVTLHYKCLGNIFSRMFSGNNLACHGMDRITYGIFMTDTHVYLQLCVAKEQTKKASAGAQC